MVRPTLFVGAQKVQVPATPSVFQPTQGKTLRLEPQPGGGVCVAQGASTVVCVARNETAVLNRGAKGWNVARFADAAVAERVASGRKGLTAATNLVLVKPLLVNSDGDAAAPVTPSSATPVNLDGLAGADLIDAITEKPEGPQAADLTISVRIGGKSVTYTGTVQARSDGAGVYTVVVQLTAPTAPAPLKMLEGSFVVTGGAADGSGVTLTEIPLWKGPNGLQLEIPAISMDLSQDE